MKLQKLIKLTVIGLSLATLAACSSMHKKNGDGYVSDVNGGGAQSSGLGESNSDRFNTDGLTPEQLLARHTYYFEFDRSEVREAEKAAIYANADYLVAHPGAKVLIEGHTDPRGSREYNVALGERRANAVADILKNKGVNRDQIRVISYGAERLAAQGRNESDYELDRRAVLVYLQK